MTYGRVARPRIINLGGQFGLGWQQATPTASGMQETPTLGGIMPDEAPPKRFPVSDDIRRQAMGSTFGPDAFRPTEAPGVLPFLGRMAELYMGYRGQTAGAQAEAQRNARAEALAQQQADREYKGDIQDRDLRSQELAGVLAGRNEDRDFRERQFAETQRHNRVSERNVGSGGADAGVYRVMTSQEVQARGLPPGSYQLNTRTNQVTPIGRVRSQYTEFAGQSAQFASRMAAADQTLRELETSVDPALVYGSAWGGGSTEVRRIRQAQREFVNAVLRRESGAAIQPSEFESARQQYFPVPGDTPEVIEQKRQARERSIVGLVNASQGAYEEWYGGEQQQQPAQQETPSGANRRQRGPIGAAPGAVIRYDAQGRRIP